MVQDVKSTNSGSEKISSSAEPNSPQLRESVLSALLQLFFFVVATAALLNGLSFWEEGHSVVLAFSRPVLWGLLACLVLIGVYLKRKKQFTPSPTAAGLGVVILFLSQWLQLRYGLLQSPVIRGEILLFATLSLAWIVKRKPLPLALLLPIASASLIYMLITTADGRILFSDDNPTFLYRLLLLKENFPNIPFYNPLWNAGIDQRDFFATGTLNFFLLFSPLIYAFSVEHAYNWLTSGLLFIVTPACVVFACHLMGRGKRACLIAGFLALAPCLLWYRWALQYGTLGFITSTALVPLNLVLATRAIGRDSKLSPLLALLFVITTTLMLFWSPSGLVFLPIILLTLFLVKRVFDRKILLLTGIILLCINLSWIGLFWKVSKVSSFLDSEKTAIEQSESPKQKKPIATKDYKEKKEHFSLDRTFEKYREIATSTNPLILLFFLPGIFLLTRDYRITFGITTPWLLFLGGAASAIKPQLELDRMLVILVILLTVPVAAAIDELLSRSERQSPWRPLRILSSAIVVGFLFASVYASGSIVKERSIVPLAFSSRLVPEMTKAIETHAGKGRVLFSGFVLHDFSGGHLAPLALFSKHPLIASSPVHNQWSYKQVFPEYFITRQDEGVQEYLNLHNVSTVLAHEKFWRDYFENRPDRYSKVWSFENFTMYTRTQYPNSYFLDGDGEISAQTSHSLTLSLRSEEAVISYNYFPFLTSKQCKLTPHAVAPDIHFIKLSNCSQKNDIVIHSVNPIERYRIS